MSRLSKEERAELEKRLKDDDAAAEQDEGEYEIGFPTGHYIRGGWKRLTEVAAAQGFKLAADPPTDPAEGKDEKPKDGNVRPFGGRRTG